MAWQATSGDSLKAIHGRARLPRPLPDQLPSAPFGAEAIG